MSMHSPTDHPDLVTLLHGELGLDDTVAATHHLQACRECVVRLGDVIVAHSMLTSSARALSPDPQRAVSSDLPALVMPPSPRRTAPGWVSLAAVAVLALTAGAGLSQLVAAPAQPTAGSTPTVTLTPTADSSTPASDPSQSATLSPVGSEGAQAELSGLVEMSADGRSVAMRISVDGLPTPSPDSYYYVWLLDPETNKMLPLGQLAPNGKAEFTIKSRLLKAYRAVDISLERDDGDPQHSPDSVLRGAFT